MKGPPEILSIRIKQQKSNMTSQGRVSFAFDDAVMVDLEADKELENDTYPEKAYHLHAETVALVDSLQESLRSVSFPAEIKQLNEKLVDLQSKILSANSKKLQARQEQNNSVLQTIHTAECVDLCFVIDATPSMKKLILSVKDNIRIVVREIKKTNPTLKLRMAIVVYTDLHYKERYQVMDFVKSLKEFEDFLCSIEAARRRPDIGDIPEDMAIGIQTANGLSWSQPTRITFIVADSPCHGFEFHNFPDNYPLGTPGCNIKQELRKLIGRDGNGTMTVYFGRLCGNTDKMIARFKHYGISLKQLQFHSTYNVVCSITNGVRSSVFKTVSTLRTVQETGLLREEHEEPPKKERVSQKQYKIEKRLLAQDDWGMIPAVQVEVYKNKPIQMENLRFPASIGRLGRKDAKRLMLLRRAPFPFAEGSTRIAYHGLISNRMSETPFPMVLKSFKFMGLDVNDRKHYLRQMEVSSVARFLAEQFNKSSARPPRAGFVHILPVGVIEEDDATNEETGLRRFCAEPLLPTDGSGFIRFSSNTGYWETGEISESLLLFCKYTHDVTNGYLLVTDLQGVRRANGDFFLTDPAILCKDTLRFGTTNVGVEFMKRCMDSTNHYLKENGWLPH